MKRVYLRRGVGDDWCGTYKTEEVETAIAVLCPVKTLEDDLVLVELPLLDRHINPDDVLPYDASSADVQVAA